MSVLINRTIAKQTK